MDNYKNVLWSAGAVLVSLLLVAVFHVGSIGRILGATGAGITNLTGLSIDGSSPGTLAVNGATTLTGAATLSGAASIAGLTTLSGGQLNTNTNSTTTTATSQTLIASDLAGYDTVIFTPNVGSDTVTLFASSTAATFLPAAGNTQRTCIINGTTTAAVNLTLAGGTGTKLLVASSSATALGSLVIGPQKEGCLTITRANSTATTFDLIVTLVSFL